MTSEIALLNKSAVALAADSAVTVTYFERGERKTRFFKGTNKIFNLSGAHPVGLMTYAAANLQGVPWEILAKAYRSHIGGKAHDHLAAYALDFFEYIANTTHIFPQNLQERQFIYETDRSAARILFPIIHDNDYRSETDQAKRYDIMQRFIVTRRTAVNSGGFIEGAAQTDVDGAVTKFVPDVQKMLEADDFYKRHVPPSAMTDLAALAIEGVFKGEFSGLEASGLVFAGYGDNDYFPRLHSYRLRGLVLGKLFYTREREIVIDQENQSDFVPFAQSEMIDTFIWGISLESMVQMDGIFMRQMEHLEKKIKDSGKMADNEDITTF
jgi:hypothetical protein